MSLWLTDEELLELTGFKTSRKQKMALAELGVPFKSRPKDGFPLVARAQFQTELVVRSQKRREPRFEHLR